MNIRNSCRFTGRILKMEKVERGTDIVLNFSLAINRRTNKKKQDQDILDFEAWNKVAELIYSKTDIGKLIEVEGEARKDKYEVEGNTKYKNYYTVNSVDIREWKDKEYIGEVSNEDIMNEVFDGEDKEEAYI